MGRCSSKVQSVIPVADVKKKLKKMEDKDSLMKSFFTNKKIIVIIDTIISPNNYNNYGIILKYIKEICDSFSQFTNNFNLYSLHHLDSMYQVKLLPYEESKYKYENIIKAYNLIMADKSFKEYNNFDFKKYISILISTKNVNKDNDDTLIFVISTNKIFDSEYEKSSTPTIGIYIGNDEKYLLNKDHNFINGNNLIKCPITNNTVVDFKNLIYCMTAVSCYINDMYNSGLVD
jgi:hypothetical protein